MFVIWCAIFVVVLYEILDALMDSIDHAKGGETLNELWHIMKLFRDHIIIIFLLAVVGIHWLYIGVIVVFLVYLIIKLLPIKLMLSGVIHLNR